MVLGVRPAAARPLRPRLRVASTRDLVGVRGRVRGRGRVIYLGVAVAVAVAVGVGL